MKRIIQITLLVLLISGTAYGQEKSDFDMEILVSDKSPKQNITITIFSPDGKKVWNTHSKSNKVFDSKSDFIWITANNWYSLSGNYNIYVELSDKYSETKFNSSLEFAMNGNEINVRTIIYISYSEEYPKLSTASFRIEKSYFSSESVVLIESWKPTPNGEPKYTIVNNSTEKIKGTSMENNLFGHIIKYLDGKWILYNRGGFCGTVKTGDNLSPGDSADSFEGYFIGEPKLFTPGRYKYCVYYTNSDYDFRIFRNRYDYTHNIILDMYLLEKEFTIE